SLHQFLAAGFLPLKITALGWAAALLAGSLLLACGGRMVPAGGATPSHRHYDFEGAATPEWQPDKRLRIGENHVLGVFNDRNPRHPPQARLILHGLAVDAPLTLEFDLFLIGTWDSGGELADFWELRTGDGPPLLRLTAFPNAFSDPDELHPLGNAGWVPLYGRQRAYWVVRQSVRVPPDRFADGTLILTFSAAVSGRRTEFWAIDQVKITPAGDR
ncbi:MAG: hypothetical protein WCD46_05620, partial [Desulfobacterales bacterium]